MKRNPKTDILRQAGSLNAILTIIKKKTKQKKHQYLFGVVVDSVTMGGLDRVSLKNKILGIHLIGTSDMETVSIVLFCRYFKVVKISWDYMAQMCFVFGTCNYETIF